MLLFYGPNDIEVCEVKMLQSTSAAGGFASTASFRLDSRLPASSKGLLVKDFTEDLSCIYTWDFSEESWTLGVETDAYYPSLFVITLFNVIVCINHTSIIKGII